MILLPVHIVAGLIAIVAGYISLFALKGAKLHRKSGIVFVYSMLILAATGAVMGAIRALSDADIVVRRAAAEALSGLDELRSAPPGLVAALSSNDAELRHHAARALASIADPATTSALVGLLSNPDADLRKDAVEGLQVIGTPAAVQAITRALTDRDPEVRKAAAEALGDLKDS